MKNSSRTILALASTLLLIGLFSCGGRRNPYLCGSCEGAGVVACADCTQDGVVTKIACATCDGDHELECPDCGGEGM